MDAELFRRVLEAFGEVCDLPPAEGEKVLAALDAEDAEIGREVQRLLKAEQEGSGRLEPLSLDSRFSEPVRSREADNRFRVGEWVVDPDAASVAGPVGESSLSQRAVAVLTELAGHPGEMRGRQQMLEAAWPGESASASDLERCIEELRRALGDDPVSPRYIEASASGSCRIVAPVSWFKEKEDAGERFEIQDQVGGGGMGVVYRAVDRRLRRTVALKFLPERERNPKVKERFLVEARAAAALDHPNICSVHEFTETAEGRMFLVMPFYEGGSVKDRLEEGRIDLQEAVRIAVEAARGLAHAHATAIVHRDIKPANLMLAADGTVKVLDFGIAKLADGQGLTGTGMLIGTPSYMSPEQARGDKLDCRTDIWSLGVVVFEMVTGRRPFTGSNDRSILRAILEEDLDIPGSVPESLAPILGKMLARTADKRYIDCEELLRDLSALLPGSSSSPQDAIREELPSPARRLSRWALPRRALPGVIGAAVIGAAVIVLGLLAWFSWHDDGVGPSRPPTLETSTPVELTREARDHLTRHYDEQEVRAAIEDFEGALALDPEHAPAYAGIAEAYRRLHEINPDEVLLTHALASAERAVELNEYLAIAHASLGLVLTLTGDLDRGEKELRQAVELDPLSAASHRELGIALWRLEDIDGARAAFSKALELDPGDWWAWTQLGSLAFSQGRYVDSEKAFLRSTEVTPDNPWAFRNLGAAMQMQERYEEAAAALQASLDIEPAQATFSNLGTLLFYQGKFSEAVAAFERAVDLAPNAHIYWGNLGDAYRWAPGRRAEAPAAFERAAELAHADLAQHPGNTTIHSRLALYYAKAEDAEKALATLAELRAVSTLDANGWYRALLTYELAGDREQALKALTSTLAAGYPLSEIEKEPELIELRRDRSYHEVVSGNEGG